MTETSATGGLSRRFWQLWTANALANLADGLVLVIVPLLAIQFTRDPILVAGATVATRLPWLLCSVPAGVVADRLDRRRICVAAQIARVVLLAGFAPFLLTGAASIWTLYCFVIELGVFEVLFTAAIGPMIPALVERRLLPRANGRIEAAEITLNELVGPPVGGLLIGVSAVLALTTTAGVYLVAVLPLLLLGGNFRPRRDDTNATLRQDIAAGVHFLWHHKVLRTLTLMVAVMAAGYSAWFAILVLYATGPMGLSAAGYGALLTARACLLFGEARS